MAETAASSWSLDENDYKRILEHMNALLQESSARCALLVDRAGQLLANAGEQLQFDPTAFASLTAASSCGTRAAACSAAARFSVSTVPSSGTREGSCMGSFSRVIAGPAARFRGG